MTFDRNLTFFKSKNGEMLDFMMAAENYWMFYGVSLVGFNILLKFAVISPFK